MKIKNRIKKSRLTKVKIPEAVARIPVEIIRAVKPEAATIKAVETPAEVPRKTAIMKLHSRN